MPKKPVGLNKPAGFLIQLESGQIMNFMPNVIRVNASVIGVNHIRAKLAIHRTTNPSTSRSLSCAVAISGEDL